MSSDAIDAAVVAKLSSDSTLTSLAPGGVYRDVAPAGVSGVYLIVSQMAHQDAYVLAGGPAREMVTFLVKAVELAKSGAGANAAAARVQALLNGAVLSISGYRCMNVERSERIAYAELADGGDARYQHRGGLYEVMAEVIA